VTDDRTRSSVPLWSDQNVETQAAGKPAQPIEKSTAGASLLVQIIVGKFASYLLIDGATLSIRRVEYDIEREIKALGQSGLPRAEWIAKPFWPLRRRCHSVHYNFMLNRG
jgi:hypothetical protein